VTAIENQARLNNEDDLIRSLTRLINTMSILIDSYNKLHEDYHNVTATLQRIESKIDNTTRVEEMKI